MISRKLFTLDRVAKTLSQGNTWWREIARDYNYKILLRTKATPQISNIASSIHWGHCGKKELTYFGHVLGHMFLIC